MALLLLLSLLALSGGSIAATPADDCVLDLAIVCLDDKLLVYVNWLEKRDKLNVVGDIVTIVKKKEPGLAEDRSKLQSHDNRLPPPHRVSTSLGPAIDDYFDTHTIRISLPWILDDDIDLELDQQGNNRALYDHYNVVGHCGSHHDRDRDRVARVQSDIFYIQLSVVSVPIYI